MSALLHEAAVSAASEGHLLSAAALAADYNELAGWLGLAPLTEPVREPVRLLERRGRSRPGPGVEQRATRGRGFGRAASPSVRPGV